MKNRSPLILKCVIGLTILVGVCIILVTNEKSFRGIVSDDIENISKLSSSIIYTEINNTLTGPIFVGQTMANDLFLENWLAEEPAADSGSEGLAVICRYLSEYGEKYGYESVFLVSDESGTYYYQNGINKFVSAEDPHDVWYYDFVASGKPYDLDVDVDEITGVLTVFVNCRIESSDGALLGVAGVGIKMSHLQEMLKKYETEYNLRAFLMDGSGLVQVDSVADNIERAHFFDRPEALARREKILGNRTAAESFWYSVDGGDCCLITQYVENLDWYLVVEKDTAQVRQVLDDQIDRDLVLVAIIIVSVLLLISYMFKRYNQVLLHSAGIDEVTGLPGNRMFGEIYARNAKRPTDNRGKVFIFDVDNFKDINDRYGHIAGNAVLRKVGEVAQGTIGSHGFVARWGGDEFVGAVYGSRRETEEIIERLVAAVAASGVPGCGGVTISLGAAAITQGADLTDLIRDADAGMYRAKESGKNRAVFFQSTR